MRHDRMTIEHDRIDGPDAEQWRAWGPFLAERSWGTVREDYSPDGEAWGWFPFEHARSRAYRWVEDGLAGLCDRRQGLCLGLALWNGVDPILKERLFGLGGKQGNHGDAAAPLHLLPQLWFRNVWSWGNPDADHAVPPRLRVSDDGASLELDHRRLGRWYATASDPSGAAVGRWLCCENETNVEHI